MEEPFTFKTKESHFWSKPSCVWRVDKVQIQIIHLQLAKACFQRFDSGIIAVVGIPQLGRQEYVISRNAAIRNSFLVLPLCREQDWKVQKRLLKK